VIFGATLNEDNKCIHIAVTNIDDLPRLQGSKYVQSDMADTYSLAKECLLNDRIVLFTGTPCQIAGLYTAVGKNKFDNLYTVDLICHGVPSPMLFKQYIDYLEKQNKGKIIHINFRSKARHGWGVAGYYTKTKTKTNYISQYKNPYMIAFLKNLSLRECCYSCKYARPERVSDITIGDLWGVEEIAPSFADKRGCSVALVNTDKGDEMISWIKDSCDIIDLNLSDVVKHQSMLQRPVERPKERDTFYEVIRQGGIERWWREYNTPVRYIKNAAKYYAGLYVPKPALALVKKSIRKILK
jgi:coenzyme F420-reducing hydrogenase beta subunit